MWRGNEVLQRRAALTDYWITKRNVTSAIEKYLEVVLTISYIYITCIICIIAFQTK